MLCGGRNCIRNRGSSGRKSKALRIELANLELEREQAVIRAPMNGIVTVGDIKVGDILERGKPVVEIAEQRGYPLRSDGSERGGRAPAPRDAGTDEAGCI